MAHGIVCFLSLVAAEGIDGSSKAFIVSHSAEWSEKIPQMYWDDKTLKDIVAVGFRTLERNFGLARAFATSKRTFKA